MKEKSREKVPEDIRPGQCPEAKEGITLDRDRHVAHCKQRKNARVWHMCVSVSMSVCVCLCV